MIETPYGPYEQPLKIETRGRKKIEVNDDIKSTILELREQGMSYRKITDRLNLEGVPIKYHKVVQVIKGK